MSAAGRPSGHPLLIEPVVAWPRQAEAERDYLVTVDLRGPLPSPDGTPAEWPYPEEEFTFTVTLDGAPHFDCSALGEPSVVLHRFGGTYGPARFRVSTGTGTGPASLWLTVSNQWGVPVRKAELRSDVRTAAERSDGTVPPAVPRAPVRPKAPPAARPEPSRQTVTVSHAGLDRAWAAWIGDRLERRGVRVVPLRWDCPPEVPPADLLRDLTLGTGRALLVLNAPYFGDGTHTHEEWNAALREVVAPDPSRFAAVSVTTATVPAGVSLLDPVALHGLEADEAERRLLDRLGLSDEPVTEGTAGSGGGPRFPAAVPEVWGGVPRRNRRFSGREALLGEAHDLLREGEPGTGVLTLHGMSGVGKTQLAVEYAHRLAPEYDVVWWVNAQDRADCRRQLAELAPRLGLQTGQEYGERLRAVRDALRRGEPYSRWLLILDGADEPDAIADLVPTGPGHVLVTSRNPEWSEHNSKLLEVLIYPRDESVAFIRRRIPRLTEAEADQLADALGDLPLLLAQTVGWLSDSDRSVDEYLALLADGTDGDARAMSEDFPPAFRTAWSILLDQLRETAPESVVLLRLCAFFAPGLVPVHLLRNMPHDGLPDSVAGLLTDPRLWDRAVGQLRRYSVVRAEPDPADSGRENLYVHRVVHRMVDRAMPEAVRGELVDVVRRALAAADRGRPSVPEQWPRYAEIVPHLKYADAFATTDSAVQTLVLDSLRYLYLSGEYGAGVRLGGHATRIWRSLLGHRHPLIWELTYHYANLLRAAGDYHRTMEIERAAVQHLREQRGERDPALLRALGGLAADLRGLGSYAEALEISERVHGTYRELLGDQDTRTLNAQNNVAVSLRLLGRYEDALNVDLPTLRARRRLLGDRHPWTLSSETTYAVDLRLLGRYEEATARQDAGLRLVRAALGANSRQALLAAHNLALCRCAVGDADEAALLFGRALEQGERLLGDSDPLVLMLIASRSCFAREHGDLDLARELSERVVGQYEATLTAGHPYAVGARANHALLLHRAGEGERVPVLAEAALADMRTAVGPDHPWTLGCALNAAMLHAHAGDTGRALTLSRETAVTAARILGPAHPFTLAAGVALAAELRVYGPHGQADGVERRALAGLADVLGPRHPHTVSARARHRPFWDFEPQRT
ncbi:FxSxx-COOH system tetratricopeptide repeat protein [Streptomyces sp. AC512_CC834]|uniref:FxSxx-COOH system tetratricopeptide repeat protein n=1 Tax=Streptomyces sp. AC512_CC834 TaxID=2823691 RepID=UPI001C2744DA|nr:FxSxx-COOH system tetratricopeptide repeat protein [Streptomyces sp. AC512_CC834]